MATKLNDAAAKPKVGYYCHMQFYVSCHYLARSSLRPKAETDLNIKRKKLTPHIAVDTIPCSLLAAIGAYTFYILNQHFTLRGIDDEEA